MDRPGVSAASKAAYYSRSQHSEDDTNPSESPTISVESPSRRVRARVNCMMCFVVKRFNYGSVYSQTWWDAS